MLLPNHHCAIDVIAGINNHRAAVPGPFVDQRTIKPPLNTMSSAEDESTGQDTPTRQQDASADGVPEAPADASQDSDEAPRNYGGESDPRADLLDHDGSPLETGNPRLSTPSTPSSDGAVLDSPEPGVVENDNVAVTTPSDADACPENEHDIPDGQLLGDAPTAESKGSSMAEEPAISTNEDDNAESTSADTGMDVVEIAQRSLDGTAQALDNDIEMPTEAQATQDISQSSLDDKTQALDKDIETPAGAEPPEDSSQPATTSPEASSSDDAPEVPYEDSPSTSRLRDVDDKSPARRQWILRKEEDRQDNEALDELMLVHGFEDVKAHFVSVYDEARAAGKRGDDLQGTKNLDVCFVEGNDSGEWACSVSATYLISSPSRLTCLSSIQCLVVPHARRSLNLTTPLDRAMVTELYIKLLQSLALVSTDVARTKPHRHMSDVWENATASGERKVRVSKHNNPYVLITTRSV